MPLDLSMFTGHIEHVIRESIKGVSGHEWDEDFITLNLLRDLKKTLSGLQLAGNDSRSKINWQTYKLKGTYETNFGDIALVLNINYRDGTEINGAAFLEAKKRDWRKTTFSAMKMPQAKRIVKSAPRSQYLLYDYEDISNFSGSSLYSEELTYYLRRVHTHIPMTPITRAVCVPLNLAIATNNKDTLLYRHGIPLSLMLTQRYFHGLDLEFDESSMKIATGFLGKFGLPKYIVKIDISENGADQKDKDLGINKNEYTQIE